MEITISAKVATDTVGGFEKLESYLREIGRKIEPELSVVLNRSATKVKSAAKTPKGIKQELGKLYAKGFLARDIAQLLKQEKANAKKLQAKVILGRKNRPSIDLFKPKWSKKNGITYTMLRTKGKQQIRQGFLVNQRAVRRKGKKRLPLVYPKGVSPAVLFAGDSGLIKKTPLKAKYYLIQETEARIQFNLYREAKKKGVAK